MLGVGLLLKRFQFRRSEDLYHCAVTRVESIAENAIARDGRFTIALSGGSTPRPLFDGLRRSQRIDWTRTHVFWSDERCVPAHDARSNYRQAFESLLRHVPIPMAQVHPMDGEAPPREAAAAYEREVRRHLGDEGRFDLILLGLGQDGHTASLFPDDPAMQETERWIASVTVPADPPQRLTMTLPLIDRARHVVFLVVGREKSEVVRRVEREPSLPAAQVNPSQGQVTWFVTVEG